MSSAVRIIQGQFGRVALLDMDRPLVTHAHSQCHVLLKASGADTYFGVRDGLQPLTDETAVLVNTWEPHYYGHEDGAPETVILALYIEPSWLASLDGVLASSAHPRFFLQSCVEISPTIRHLTQDLTADLLYDMALDREAAEERVFELMIAIIDQFSEWRSLRRALRMARIPTDYRIRRAISYMRENLGEPLDVNRLAEAAGLSRSHFFKTFRENTGLTPRVYSSVLRMESAIKCIAGTKQSMGELAFDLGFSAQSHFTRFFQSHQGVAPSDYRRIVEVFESTRSAEGSAARI